MVDCVCCSSMDNWLRIETFKETINLLIAPDEPKLFALFHRPTPLVNVNALRGNPESRGPLGPLTPEALSPNVLCITGEEGQSERQLLWESLDSLPNMQSIYISSPRLCQNTTTLNQDCSTPASFGCRANGSNETSNPSTTSGGSSNCLASPDTRALATSAA